MTARLTPPRPFIDLVSRYRNVISAAWLARTELAGPTRLTDEVAFLPAALCLQETPVHPAPRRVAGAICLLFIVIATWSFFGQVDIVAVAAGHIVVSDNTKTLQTSEAGVVKKIFVKNGDEVQVGQILVELDETIPSADAASVEESLSMVRSEEHRAATLLQSLRSRQPPTVRPSPSTRTPGSLSTENAQLDAEWKEISAKLAKFEAEAAHREAEISTAKELVSKLDAVLPIARVRENDFHMLAEKGFISSHALQDRTRERIEQERDLATQRARLAETISALQEVKYASAAYFAETVRILNERRAQASSKQEQLVQERSKMKLRRGLTRLAAPVTGTIQQLAIHTEGAVVTPAQVLMVIVPKDAHVTAEVLIDNKDIGFVYAGQAAEVKLETFPYTRYGTVSAKVRSVAADAIFDEKRGAIFPATLTLDRDAIQVDGKLIRLSPGMNANVEIKTGHRRLIEYLLQPTQESMSESLRER